MNDGGLAAALVDSIPRPNDRPRMIPRRKIVQSLVRYSRAHQNHRLSRYDEGEVLSQMFTGVVAREHDQTLLALKARFPSAGSMEYIRSSENSPRIVDRQNAVERQVSKKGDQTVIPPSTPITCPVT
jgi:hypothetical protein